VSRCTVLSTTLAADSLRALVLRPAPERARLEIGNERDADARRAILGAKADLSVEARRELEGGQDTLSVLQVA
jgi:hypothetical protein